jgi:hypothetical protein
VSDAQKRKETVMNSLNQFATIRKETSLTTVIYVMTVEPEHQDALV